MMELGTYRLRRTGLARAGGRRGCLQLHDLLLELRDLFGTRPRQSGLPACQQRRACQHCDTRPGHGRTPQKAVTGTIVAEQTRPREPHFRAIDLNRIALNASFAQSNAN